MELVTSTVFSPGKRGDVSLDQILVLPREGLVAVADAPGAGPDGRAGVRIALDTVRTHIERHSDVIERFRRHPTPDLTDRVVGVVEEAFGRAASELFAFARRREGLEVVLDVLMVVGNDAFIGHVGNTRTYLVRRGLVHQLTVDHVRDDDGTVFELIDAMDVGAEVTSGPVLARALGPKPDVAVETVVMQVSAEDRFVLCTADAPRAIDERTLQQHFAGQELQALEAALKREAGDRALVAAALQLGSGRPSQPEKGADRLSKLAPMPLFTHCTRDELRVVAAATRPRRFGPEEVIFHQGAPGTELYLLIEGDVRIEKDGSPIVTLGPGSNFGEMAMLDEPSRSASAIAVDHCEALVIPRAQFFAMLQGNPLLAVKILWNMLLKLSSRLRDTSARLAALSDPTIREYGSDDLVTVEIPEDQEP